MAEAWTLGELVERASRALAAADVQAPNGRVTPLPDGRVIRWYATIGLVDRPGAMHGRTAVYGPRHLLQLVAVKRRQAQGHTLAEIQAELTGATDELLSRIADIPDSGVPAAGAVRGAPRRPTVAVSRRRFWTQTPTVNPEGLLSGVRLTGGAVLLLPTTPDAVDLAEIESAARPLLDLLAARGLLTTTPADNSTG